MNFVSILLLAVLVVFGGGYALGRALFEKSKNREVAAILCGFAALFVVSAIAFAGCVAAFSKI